MEGNKTNAQEVIKRQKEEIKILESIIDTQRRTINRLIEAYIIGK